MLLTYPTLKESIGNKQQQQQDEKGKTICANLNSNLQLEPICTSKKRKVWGFSNLRKKLFLI